MTMVTVSSLIGTTCHYWLTPNAKLDTTDGEGVEVPAIQHGWVTIALDGSPTLLSLSLDSGFTYDVLMDFRNAPPIRFEGFAPGAGGNLIEMLSAQGWVSP